MDEDSRQIRLAAALRQHDVDRIVLCTGDAPKVGGGTMRCHRPTASGEHRSSDRLLPTSSASVQAGDAGVQLLDMA